MIRSGKKIGKIRLAKFNGRYYCKINNSLPFDFLGPPEETYSRLIAIRKFRLVNLMEILPTRSQQPGRSRREGWTSGMGLVSPGYVYLPGVPSESNREQRRRGLIFYRRFPEFGELGLANSQNGNATPSSPLRLGFTESHIPIFTFRFSIRFFLFATAKTTTRPDAK